VRRVRSWHLWASRKRSRSAHPGAAGSVSIAPSGRNGWDQTTFAGGTDPARTVSSGARDDSRNPFGGRGNLDRRVPLDIDDTARRIRTRCAADPAHRVPAATRPGKWPPWREDADRSQMANRSQSDQAQRIVCTLHLSQSSRTPSRARGGRAHRSVCRGARGPGLRTVPRCRGSGSARLRGRNEPEPTHRFRREGPAHRVPEASSAREGGLPTRRTPNRTTETKGAQPSQARPAALAADRTRLTVSQRPHRPGKRLP
jgi:hypothetical protein